VSNDICPITDLPREGCPHCATQREKARLAEIATNPLSEEQPRD
jgi:hypothetical protein